MKEADVMVLSHPFGKQHVDVWESFDSSVRSYHGRLARCPNATVVMIIAQTTHAAQILTADGIVGWIQINDMVTRDQYNMMHQ
jgi:hypothetical protein